MALDESDSGSQVIAIDEDSINPSDEDAATVFADHGQQGMGGFEEMPMQPQGQLSPAAAAATAIQAPEG